MGYLLWFGIVALIFALLHYFTELSGRQKGMISLIVTLVVAGAVVYNIQADKEREHFTKIELKYTHGEKIDCDGVEINASTFSYSVGTQSFVGNKGTPHYQQIFSASECE